MRDDVHFEKLKCLTDIAGRIYVAVLQGNEFDLQSGEHAKLLVKACAKTAADIVEACADEAFGRASADEKEGMQ